MAAAGQLFPCQSLPLQVFSLSPVKCPVSTRAGNNLLLHTLSNPSPQGLPLGPVKRAVLRGARDCLGGVFCSP